MIGSTEFGLKSDGLVGYLIFGTGLIVALFQLFVTSDLDKLQFIRNVNNAETAGAAILRNQKGRLPTPVAVD